MVSMDPIQSVHVKLLASDLLSLEIRNGSFFRNGRLVSLAETVGVVVSCDRKDKFLKFLVDDSTGCIPCILWLNHYSFPDRYHPIDLQLKAEMALQHAQILRLGALVRVRGRITLYRSVIQITVGDAVAEKDPNSEMLHWLECIKLARKCYDAPYPPIHPVN